MGNYKSASRQLQNSGQLQNNTFNCAMSIAINHVINVEIVNDQYLVCRIKSVKYGRPAGREKFSRRLHVKRIDQKMLSDKDWALFRRS